MRAWLMDSAEGVERLRLGEVADPRPGPTQVLLRMRVAALNPADAFLARRMYPAKPPLLHILGLDGVGDVVTVGHGVEEFTHQFQEHVQPIHLRHHNVCDAQIRRPVAVQLKSLTTVDSFRDLIPCRFKIGAEEYTDDCFVIDDQNGDHSSPTGGALTFRAMYGVYASRVARPG